MDAKQVWRAVLGELQVSLSPANFETWLKDTSLVEVDENRFRIAAPNGFARDWLDNRLHLFEDAISLVADNRIFKQRNVDIGVVSKEDAIAQAELVRDRINPGVVRVHQSLAGLDLEPAVLHERGRRVPSDEPGAPEVGLREARAADGVMATDRQRRRP